MIGRMVAAGEAEGAAIWIAAALGPLGFANYRHSVGGMAAKLLTHLDETTRKATRR